MTFSSGNADNLPVFPGYPPCFMGMIGSFGRVDFCLHQNVPCIFNWYTAQSLLVRSGDSPWSGDEVGKYGHVRANFSCMAGRTGSSLITRPMASSFFCIAPPPSCLLSRSSCSWSLASYTCSCQQGGVSSRRCYNYVLYVHAGTILATEVHTKSDLPASSSLAECTGDRHDRW